MSYSSEVLTDSPLAYYRLGEAPPATTSAAAGSDSWATAVNIDLSGVGDVSTASMSNAALTVEAGEPNPTGYTAYKTAWWKFTAPDTGNVIVDTSQSSGDTEIAVYTGSALDSLTKVASDSDSGGAYRSLLNLAATQGVTYYIQVSAYGGATMDYVLRLRPQWPVTMVDSSGNGRDGTYSGTYTLGATGLLTGDADTCVDFTNGQGRVTDGAWMDVTAVTVEAVVQLDAVNEEIMVERDAQTGTERMWQFRSNAGKFEFLVFTSAGTGSVASGATLATGTKYHLAATFDGATVKVYINGALDNSAAHTGTLASGTQDILIGRSSYSSIWPTDGRIDEVAYYGTALSSTRIAAHHAAATTTVTPTGTVSGTLPPLSANLSGGIEFSSTVAAVLPALGADLSGTSLPPGVAGTLSATLPPLGGSLAGAYSDTGTLAAILPPLSADFAGAALPQPVTGAVSAALPNLAANFVGTSVDPGVSGVLSATLPALSASLSGHILGRAGFGLALDSSATVTVDAALDATVTSTTVPLHVVTPTVPVPTLVAGRPS